MRDSTGTKIAGQKDYCPFSHHMVANNVLTNHWETYTAGAQSAGREPDRQKWKISRNIFVAETTAEAREKARNLSLGKCLEFIMKCTDLGPGRKLWKRDLDMPDSECTLDYLMEEQVIAGDPDDCVRQLHRMMEETGEFGTLIMTAHDWDDRESWITSLELFAREVMPKLNKSLGYT